MDNITTIAQMLSTHVQQALPSDYGLADIEQVTRRLLQEVGRQTVAAVVHAEEGRYPEAAWPCPHCGSTMSYIRQRTAQLRTLLGRLEVRRAYYLCSACHAGCYPLDRRLGLRPNAISAEVERLAAMTGVQLPFEKGRDLFESLTLVSLSDQTVDKATQTYGARVVGQEAAWRADTSPFPEWLTETVEMLQESSHPHLNVDRIWRNAVASGHISWDYPSEIFSHLLRWQAQQEQK